MNKFSFFFRTFFLFFLLFIFFVQVPHAKAFLGGSSLTDQSFKNNYAMAETVGESVSSSEKGVIQKGVYLYEDQLSPRTAFSLYILACFLGCLGIALMGGVTRSAYFILQKTVSFFLRPTLSQINSGERQKN